MSVSFGDVFDRVARAAGDDAPAIVCDDAVLTWGEFDRRSNALARRLLAAGLTVNSKVAHYLRNGPEYLIAFAACAKARASHVNVNYRYGVDELAYLLDNSDAEAVIYEAHFAPLVAALRPRLPNVRLWLVARGADGDAETFEAACAGDGAPLANARSSDDEFLLYTGGTTGLPKGVMWPFGAFWGALGPTRAPMLGLPVPETLDALEAQILSGAGRAPVYVAPPLMHGTGLFSAVNALTKAAPVVVSANPSFDPAAALDAVTRWRCGGFIIVGDAFARPLVDALRADPGRYETAQMQFMLSSGMMWSPEVKSGLLEFMPNAMLLDSFGASEGTGLGLSVATKDLPPREARFDAPQTKIVRAEDFSLIPPGSDEIGLVAKTGFLPKGYYKDPEKTARTYVMIEGERYVVTGDHARIEADGAIKLLGRGSHCINSGGEKIYPEEVEEALKTHPAVHDALVFGAPDPRFGQRVIAVVGFVDGARADTADLIAHVREKLAPYKAPREIVTAAAAPRAPNGKADYAAAKALYAASIQGAGTV